MKKIEIDLDYGMTEEELAAFGMEMTIPGITWFLIDQCFAVVFNSKEKGGMGSDNGAQYREVRLAFQAALKEKEEHVLLSASDYNFTVKTVENAKLATGLAFIKPVLQIALRDAADVPHLKEASKEEKAN